ncbi:permease YjgP/YjgQ family protein [Luminiphilus syltensis NOR5-1B]|uniref:Permease YjgP/YjgQ family protein n=1 Tax=Luminiphilus syltensis NOR5-1B TaxID=565045 RepID=B8KR06_9GAMM|nr:LPS export ABC transporter permease LptG [Luminiphilus syltensis]EED34818.1 permease YjgP/YjgQ family protein [Luminiphilus syltensis NOR5-1B]
MGKIDRYIGRAILGGTFAVLGVLVGLDALSTIVDEAEDLSDRYGFIDMMSYVGLTLPRRIHEFMPFAALIGALVGLGRLAGSSELVVVRSAGVSIGQLAISVMKPALLAAVVGFVVGDFIAPSSEQLAITQRALAQRSESTVSARHGSWNRDGGTFIHVSAVQRGGVAYGLSLFSFDEDKHLVRSLNAERGTYRGDHWLLEEVVLTQLESEKTTVSQYLTWRWNTQITPDLLVLEVVEPESLPVFKLWPWAKFLEQQGLTATDIELAFWRKVTQPLAIAGLVLVAMSFIFGPLREGSMGARIFAGVIVGVMFRISQDFFGPASVLFGLPPVLAAITPILFCWLAGIWLLNRRT